MYLWCFSILVLVSQCICDEKDGGKAPRIALHDGNAIPSLGYGSFLGFDENGQKEVKEGEVEIPVTWALQAGYRLIDTAAAYHNEEQIGLAVRKSGVPRENVFIVTKLDSTKQRDPVGAIRESLQLLNMSYVDLFLIHNPVAFKPNHSGFDVVDYLDTWRGMEKAQNLGLAKSIGISNFNISQMDRLLANCQIKPTVLQVEVNLNLGQAKIIDYCKRHNMVVMAYTPFGSLFDKQSSQTPKSNDPVLVALANKYGKTTPQVVLKFLVQKGVVPIPKSVHKERIEQNIDIFDFNLTSEEMETLSKFNNNHRTVHPSFWQDHPYYPFERKDKPDADIFKPKN